MRSGEKIGRTMKRLFCDRAITGKGIVKAISMMRGDHSATNRQTRSGQSRSADVKAIVGDGIVKARGDRQSNRRCEAVLGGDCQRGPIGNILRREFS
jgi:hypothetical protein